MAIYTHFGGIRGLVAAVADEGIRQLGEAQAAVVQTNDPVADLISTSVKCRQFAIDNSDVYRLIFGGNSIHGFCANSQNAVGNTYAISERQGLEHLLRCVRRAMAVGRIHGSPEDLVVVHMVAAKLWAVIHGSITLELVGFWGVDGSAGRQALASLTMDLFVALGDSPENATNSAAAAAAAQTRP